jgi:DNA-binding beta-propeller fold protein YncE
LKQYLIGKNYDGKVIEKQHKPHKKGIGEVWVDTAYELTAGKEEWFPGTATVVSATGWNVNRKIALPEQKMNNGHNFWTSNDQKDIYETEWHGNSLYVINRHNGKLIQEIDLVNGPEVSQFSEKCHDPAHVMTRLFKDDSDKFQVHVGCNGNNTVVELDRDPATRRLSINRFIPMSTSGPQAQPHAHWMGYNGESMITPNSNTGDETTFSFNANNIVGHDKTGLLPIATGMMPDSSKYYVSNYLGLTISVICGQKQPTGYSACTEGQWLKNINLLVGPGGNYNYETGEVSSGDNNGAIGGFSVQTPVSPDGKFVIQGNTLTGTITIIDTATDKLVKSLACDPGCHGVNFGAKKGGGYFAYVTSKFANRLIVLDYDPNNDGNVDDAVIAGAVVLANDHVAKDDKIIGNKGFGGQGVMAVPNVYNGWVQQLPIGYKAQLTRAQRNPIGPLPGHNPHDVK